MRSEKLQLRAIAAKQGYTVVAVPVTKALHLKTAVTALPDGTVIGYPPLVDDPAVFDRFLPVPVTWNGGLRWPWLERKEPGNSPTPLDRLLAPRRAVPGKLSPTAVAVQQGSR